MQKPGFYLPDHHQTEPKNLVSLSVHLRQSSLKTHPGHHIGQQNELKITR